jgi:hypothetical protein
MCWVCSLCGNDFKNRPINNPVGLHKMLCDCGNKIIICDLCWMSNNFSNTNGICKECIRDKNIDKILD